VLALLSMDLHMHRIHAYRFCLGDQRLLWVQDSDRVQNPYKKASLTPYLIESIDWLPFVANYRTFLSNPVVDHAELVTVVAAF
jgi:hypothetical protein